MVEPTPTNNSAPVQHYGAAAIRRSLMHFMLGKGVAIVSTLITLLLLVRQLPAAEFGAYTSLNALALILGLISSMGIPQVLNRYLPELRTQHNYIAMYRLLFAGIFFRALCYMLVCALLLPVLGLLAATFKLDAWSAIVPIYLLVGFLRVNATFISQSLESLLWQRDSQYSLALGALIKLLGVLYMAQQNSLTLVNFVWLECVSEGAVFCCLHIFILIRWLSDDSRAQGNKQILVDDRRRYMRFGYWCYAQNFTSILYGSAPNRLFVAYMFSAEYIVIYGVIDRFVDFVRRYEPLKMFVGLVRPVLMSRYSVTQGFSKLVSLANLILFANFAILVAPLPLLVVAGDELLAWLTHGRYMDLKWLSVGCYAVLAVASINNLLDMLVKAVEQNRVYIFSNMLLSGSLLLAVPLLPYVNLWAIVIANMTGLLLAFGVIRYYLKARGYIYQLEWRHVLTILGATAIAAGIGFALRLSGVNIWLATGATAMSYAGVILYFWPLAERDNATIRELLPPRLRRFYRVRNCG
jgi:O-antigen/teichoic acid export membrane protein